MNEITHTIYYQGKGNSSSFISSVGIISTSIGEESQDTTKNII